jgi:pilus assembly protein Flp/PilA
LVRLQELQMSISPPQPADVGALALVARDASVRSPSIKALVARFFADTAGASAAEYALILALIGAVIITALTNLGTAISNQTQNVANTIGS